MEVNVTATAEQNVFNVTVEQGGSGSQGPKGDPGESAYQVAVDNGFVGTESEWLASLVGPQGIPGADGADGAQGIQGPAGEKGEQGEQGIQGERGETGANGSDGADGESAYQIWLDNGNTGSEQDFLDSLVGPAGTTDYNDLQNKPALGTAAEADASDFATSSQGELADTALQPAAIANIVESEQEGGVGTLIKNIVAMTQAQYDGITPKSDTFYIITD